jgi:hypothetical protein
MGHKYLKWSIVGPVGLLLAALVALAWLDVSTGGDAKPKPLTGTEGTPVRFAYVVPTGTPPGAKPTATPVPGAAATPVPDKAQTGNAADRDGQRRADLLVIFDAIKKLRDKDGKFPATNGNAQSLCIYRNTDALCALEQFLGGPPPEDPSGGQNGYWYSGAADGQSMKLFASLETATLPDPNCTSNDEALQKRPNLICLTIP